jgi:hypothetical protein
MRAPEVAVEAFLNQKLSITCEGTSQAKWKNSRKLILLIET